ncbi:hypothetical protein [Novosphingobium sp. PASSN1]|uniref:hypothetical protein n=1 Tax=Novosphingobium sp. PASSN1 TaxID=2015561 RepID=UPI000BD09D20|nr:hypothetical protein [Novosphingobium sp. PASSN1]OYU36112.1 MAG: hypothetical protein CFE35_07575 [Novosphingobium sp. PASSN1]
MPLNARSQAPASFWIIAVLGLLWNLLGCYDYLMSQLSPQSYFASMGMDDASVAYMAQLPVWLTGFWALGVWGSLVGSLLLLARSRRAVLAFALSLLGLAVSQLTQAFWLHPPMAAPVGLALTVWSALVFFLIHARSMAAKGVLS